MDPSRFGQTGARRTGRRLTRRATLASGGAGLATALLGTGGPTRIRPAAAQEASPSPITEAGQIPGTVGTLFSVIAVDLPPAPVEVTLARVVSQPGDGDLEDFFTFPGPLAFVLESGAEVCRCGTAESPCLLLRADGTSEPAPPIPADIPLVPGEGLYIPANTPDSFFIPGDEPAVELDLSIFPPQAPAGTPEATPTG
jgi:hypothetical protein